MIKNNPTVLRSVPDPSNDGKSKESEQKISKKQQFRQQRYSNELISLALSYKSFSAQVLNWSRTGIAFEALDAELGFEVNEILPGIRLSCSGVPVYNGSIQIKSKRPHGAESTQYGAAFVGNFLLIEGIEAASHLARFTLEATSAATDIRSISPGFCQAVTALIYVLDIIKGGCEHEEKRWEKLPLELRKEAEDIFMPQMAERVLEILVEFNREVGNLIDVDALKEDSVYHKIFDKFVYPYFKGADVFRRTHDKPRGYAGDYEMMNQVYRDGYEGENLFSRVLHHYGTIEDCGESVKFRRPYLVGQYRQALKSPGPKRVLAVASGPAIECQTLVQDFDQEQLDRLHITLFDLDREALEHAQTKIFQAAIDQNKTVSFDFINESVKNFLVSDVTSGEGFDLIYSAGLFDYLDQRTAIILVHKFFKLLKPGGRLVVGNFTKNNSSKAFLNLLCKWKLVHRTHEEILEWVKDVPGSSNSLDFDRGKNLAFLVIDKVR